MSDDDPGATGEAVRIPIEAELDLHAFRPRDVAAVVEDYVEEAARAGLARVRIVHGRGTGTQREIVRATLARSPHVVSFEDAPPARGGWGATLAVLGPPGSAIPTGDTLVFLAGALPPPPARLLEVGAGHGALAARLTAQGYAVHAIDTSPEAVAVARTRGIDVALVDFLELDAPAFDAVLFTRALHHIDPLAGAVDQAAALIVAGGTLVLEEFAWERMDEAAAAWLEAHDRRLVAEGTIAPPDEDAHGAGPVDPLARWRAHHQGHGVHTGAALLAAVERRFEMPRVEAAPYLYRYLCARARGGEAAARALRDVLDEERARIGAGTLAAVGLRVVARRR